MGTGGNGNGGGGKGEKKGKIKKEATGGSYALGWKKEMRACSECRDVPQVKLPGDEQDGLELTEGGWPCTHCGFEEPNGEKTKKKKKDMERGNGAIDDDVREAREEDRQMEERWQASRREDVRDDQDNLQRRMIDEREGAEPAAKEEDEEENNWVAELSNFIEKPLIYDEDILRAARERERHFAHLREEEDQLMSEQEDEEESRAKEDLQQLLRAERDEHAEARQRILEMEGYYDGVISDLERAGKERLEKARRDAEEQGRRHAEAVRRHGLTCGCRFCRKMALVNSVVLAHQ